MTNFFQKFLTAAAGALIGGLFAIAGALVAYYLAWAPPQPSAWQIVPQAEGDCEGLDRPIPYKVSKRPGEPDGEYCTFTFRGTAAVCWDGKKYSNPSNPDKRADAPWCTYKAISAKGCQGGGTKGFMYVCEAQR